MNKLYIGLVLIILTSCKEKKTESIVFNSVINDQIIHLLRKWEISQIKGNIDVSLVSDKYKKLSNYEDLIFPSKESPKDIPNDFNIAIKFCYGSVEEFDDRSVIYVRYYIESANAKIFNSQLLMLHEGGKYSIIPKAFWQIAIEKRSRLSYEIEQLNRVR